MCAKAISRFAPRQRTDMFEIGLAILVWVAMAVGILWGPIWWVDAFFFLLLIRIMVAIFAPREKQPNRAVGKG